MQIRERERETVQVTSERRIAHLNSLPPNKLLKEVTKAGEVFVRQEMIPLDMISLDGIIIDEKHASDLGELMVGKWQQTQAIAVRCRMGGATVNDVRYDILDGFHRVAGLHARQGKEIKAEVYYNCSDEEMYDQRIIAANSVKSVKFARMAFWMNGAWAQTPWRNKITVAQAFGLTQFESSGKILRLAPDEVKEITNWCTQKAKRWLAEVGTLYQDLRVVEDSNKELLMRVRTGSFVAGGLALTKPQFETIVKAFPKREGIPLNEAIQMRIAELANSQSLSTPQIQSFVAELRQLPDRDITMEAVSEVFRNGVWRGTIVTTGNGETKPEGYGINQILSTAKTLEKRVRYSPNLSSRDRDRLLGEVAVIYQYIDEAGKTQEIQVEANQFISHWFNPNTIATFRSDPSTEERFRTEVENLKAGNLSEVATHAVEGLYSLIPDSRDIAAEILKRLPLGSLDPTSQAKLFKTFISGIQKLDQGKGISQDTKSSILESLPEALDSIKEIAVTQPELWRELVAALKLKAETADLLCRQVVFNWAKANEESNPPHAAYN